MISGHHIVSEYSGLRLATITTESYRARHGPQAVPSFIADQCFVQRVSGEATPEGILAQIPYPTNIATDISTAFKNSLMLFNVVDPRNLGSLTRTALALGWDQLIVFGDKTVDPFNLEAIRCSKGALLRIPRIVITKSSEMVFERFKRDSQIFLAERSDPPSSSKLESEKRRLLILGSESHGLRDLPSSLRSIGHAVSIPTSVSMPFLSVSAAGAILMNQLQIK